jgi:predicted DNA-binding transcriptional regulator YafY
VTAQYRTFDIASMSDVELVGESGAFEPPALPAREQRDHRLDVVLRVPVDSAAFNRLRDGWGARTVSRDGGQVEVRIAVDRPAASRVAVLLLQLGPECSVVSPESLQDAVLSVAQRILDAHSV